MKFERKKSMKSTIVYKRQKKYENYEIDGDLQGQWILDEKTQLVCSAFFFLDFTKFREMRRFQKLKNTKMEMLVPNLNGAISVWASVTVIHTELTVIFNHFEFVGENAEVNTRRDGTKHDVNKERFFIFLRWRSWANKNIKNAEKLERVFTELEFIVHTYHDYTKKEIQNKLDEYQNLNMDDCEMFGLAIMTHGDAQGWPRCFF